ncbi:hypothetical protein LTR78_010652 [Recurvomyces mirabilis]|uniref:JmjC domain-containing protein n=1 Tax=Recurvomyces mirabilis TaxID=574656 RepID=A0AAE0TRP8_9PEZI|nr:hypothetical protein LTR78_010652 [Recurvomyces mirabilis]
MSKFAKLDKRDVELRLCMLRKVEIYRLRLLHLKPAGKARELHEISQELVFGQQVAQNCASVVLQSFRPATGSPAYKNLVALEQTGQQDALWNRESRRCMRLVANVAAHWGLQVVMHYGWQDCTRGYLESLWAAAQSYPDWENAVDRLNAVMFRRHDGSIRSGSSQSQFIGVVEDRRFPHSPVTRIDLQNIALWHKNGTVEIRGYTITDLQAELQVVERWLSYKLEHLRFSTGLRVIDMPGSAQATHLLAKDEFGILVQESHGKKRERLSIGTLEDEGSPRKKVGLQEIVVQSTNNEGRKSNKGVQIESSIGGQVSLGSADTRVDISSLCPEAEAGTMANESEGEDGNEDESQDEDGVEDGAGNETENEAEDRAQDVDGETVPNTPEEAPQETIASDSASYTSTIHESESTQRETPIPTPISTPATSSAADNSEPPQATYASLTPAFDCSDSIEYLSGYWVDKHLAALVTYAKETDEPVEKAWLLGSKCPKVYCDGGGLIGNANEVDADLLCLSAEAFDRKAKDREWKPQVPILLKQDFLDKGAYTLDEAYVRLQRRYSDAKLQVQFGLGDVGLLGVKDFAKSAGRSHLGLNAIDLRPLLNVDRPMFTRLGRYKLLEDLTESVRGGGNPGKQQETIKVVQVGGEQSERTEMRPNDMASCIQFALLAHKGAFSGSHVDIAAGTFVRQVAGDLKFWMFVKSSDMTTQDWENLNREGCHWLPGGKSFLVPLEQGDVFIMPAGPRIVHAVSTPEPSYMEGGMFWDECNIVQILESVHWICEHQAATNEAIPYQLSEVLVRLWRLVEAEKAMFRNGEQGKMWNKTFQDLRSKFKQLGCYCEDCALEICPCDLKSRRCTRLCEGHPYLPGSNHSCMKERW